MFSRFNFLLFFTLISLPSCYKTKPTSSNATDFKETKPNILSATANIDSPKTCHSKLVGEILQICCESEYIDGVYNCQNFAAQFQGQCNLNGVTCRTVGASCTDNDGNSLGAHRFNSVFLPEKMQWCIVEPQGGDLICPVSSPPTSDDVCKLWKQNGWDQGKGCKCEVRPAEVGEIGMPSTYTFYCALNRDNLEDCNSCCNTNGTDEPWKVECKSSCRNHHGKP